MGIPPWDGIQMKEGGARVAGMLGSWGKESVWALDAAELTPQSHFRTF